MSLLAANCQKLNVYTKLLSTPAVSSIFNRFAAYDSKKFPGFKVIYALDYVPRISIANRLKYRMSIITGVAIPTTIAIESFATFNNEILTTFSFLVFTVTLFLHGVGTFCNNVVGYVYAKHSTEEVIVSYVDFWGRRVDVESNYSKLNITDTKNIVMKPVFNTLRVEGHPKPLKMYIYGKILDEILFDKVCGINF